MLLSVMTPSIDATICTIGPVLKIVIDDNAIVITGNMLTVIKISEAKATIASIANISIGNSLKPVNAIAVKIMIASKSPIIRFIAVILY
ncbi:hypothetical protein CAXC1_120040 [Candidatus Xenohaliotis californiensis]|uniref:Uncharacterized protein n=1 Tax=Candidatus Xenohaliotis californiensis TaxID=84677 RepID=A0ABP0ERM5_9RICK|nr:hypothetical protein CAXC1_120040 [Candidatus Xenohaliotis californiensis]